MRPNRRRMQMVYQDPFGSPNPRMKVGSIIGEPLRVHGLASDPEGTIGGGAGAYVLGGPSG